MGSNLIPGLPDYETDTVIQQFLREELGKDVTVLTVAHRLHSVMDADRIVGFNTALWYSWTHISRHCR